MTIPGATTTITVQEPTQTEPYEAVTWADVASGVRAVIGLGTSGGSESPATGAASTVNARLTADPVALTHDMRGVDDTTGDTYAVVWSVRRVGLGLEHTTAGLRKVAR